MSKVKPDKSPSFPFYSFRDYLAWLDENDMLVHITEEVSNKWQTTAISREFFVSNGYGYAKVKPKIPFYENFVGYPGVRGCNLAYGHIDLVAAIMGTTREKIFQDYFAKMRKPVPPTTVEKAYFTENTFKGDEVDLYKIPLETTSSKQSGPFLTFWASTFKSPVTGEYAFGIYRHNVKSRKHVGMLVIPGQRTHRVYLEHKKEGRSMPITLVNAPPPACVLIAQARTPPGVSKLNFAGALQGAPVECVNTDVNQHPVPSTCEYVLEGEMPTDILEPEGPFGEFSGLYSMARDLPIINIKAMHVRDNPIYNSSWMGKPPSEGHLIGELMQNLGLTMMLRQLAPEVVAVRTISSWALMMAVVIDKKMKTKGTAARVASIAAALQPGSKTWIVVEDDVDYWSIEEILWAMATRWAPNRTIIYGPLPGWRLDPTERLQSGYPVEEGVRYVAIIDATEPMPPYDEYYKRGIVDIPEQVKENAKQIASKYLV